MDTDFLHRTPRFMFARIWFCFMAMLGPVVGGGAARGQTRVLFVGNSFTHGKYAPVLQYNAAGVTDENAGQPAGSPRQQADASEPGPWGGVPGIFQKLTEQAGLSYAVHLEAISGAALQDHHAHALSVIQQSRWDQVVLQEQSTRPLPAARGGQPAAFADYATRLEGAVHAANPAARVYLYQTWARADLTYPAGQPYSGQPVDSMTRHLHDAYFGLAARGPQWAGVAPVGDAWLRAIGGSVAVRNPYAAPAAGQLNLWAADQFHASKWGSYLSACVLFGRLTGRDPRALGGGEAAAAALGIAPAEATALQEVAYQQLQVGGELPATGFTLVDADTDQDVQALANGAVLNLATLPSRNLNIRANVNAATTASVVFNLNGAQTHTQTENVVPYALFSDASGNYNPWTPAVGSYTLRATPYAGSNGGGTAGQAMSINFSVTDAGAGPFVLNTSVFGGGTLARSLDQATYPVGTVVTLTATPTAGFGFTGWSGSAVGAANPLAVTMDGNRSITATFTATPAGNQAPVLAAIGNRTATVGQALSFTATATDPDAGQALAFALAGPAPAGAVINASTGAFSWTPAAAGSFALTVRVADGGSPVLADEETLTVTVSAPPAGGFAFYRAVNLGGPALALDGNAWAASTAPNYSTNGTAFTNSAVALVPATDAVRTGLIRDAVYGPNLSAILANVPAGSYQAYLWVWEDNNAETYSLALNGQPVLANASSGPAGTWARLGPYPVALAAPGAVAFTSSGGWQNFSGIELWQQTDTPAPNQAPVLAAIGNRTATVGQPLTFTASATDPNAGQTNTFSLESAPLGATINALSGAFSWTPGAGQVDAFSLTVRVADNGSPVLTDEETLTVSVSAAPVNQPPVLAAIGNRTATVGQVLTLTATATDPDAGQTRTFGLIAPVPAGASINPTSGLFNWTPAAAGSFALTVRVSDNGSPVATDDETLTISVSAPANQAPVLAAIGNRTATVGQALTFTASATDPDAGQTRTFALVAPVPAGAVINASTGAFGWTPAAAGSFTLTVRVADNGSPVLTDEETLTVTVSAAPPGGTFAFYRAVNLGGPALALDGNAWAASTAPNFTTNGSAFTNSTVALVPATDAARAGMIRNAVYRPGSISVAFSAVPAGTYRLYAYAWEDNNPEIFGLVLNGQSVLSNASSGPAGTWRRLGPYQVSLAATGAVTLTSSGGTVNLSGVELWRQTGAARPAGPAVASGPALARRAVLFPNPTTDGRLWVQLTPDWAGEVRYELHSVLGALVATGTCAVPDAAAPMALDLSRHLLATGMYHLRLGGSAGQQVWLRVLRD